MSGTFTMANFAGRPLCRPRSARAELLDTLDSIDLRLSLLRVSATEAKGVRQVCEINGAVALLEAERRALLKRCRS